MLDDLLALLGKASVSVVDGGELTIKIRSATPSTEFRREAVNAYVIDKVLIVPGVASVDHTDYAGEIRKFIEKKL